MGGSLEGESYQTEADFWGASAATADTDAAAEQAGGEAFLGDLQTGGSIGSSAGIVGGIVGMIVGAIVGAGDADATTKAVKLRLEEDKARRIKLEKELEDTMNMRDEIENNLAGLMNPLEQKFRTRARLFGAQQRAQGVTGAQALAGSVLAEEQYRQQVGPQLPALYREARGLAREQALTKLRAIELREGIELDRQKMQMQSDMMHANQRSSLMKGVSSTAINVGQAIGGLAQEGIDAQGQTGLGMTMGGDALGGGGLDSDPVTDIYGEGLPDDLGMSDMAPMGGAGAGGLV